VARESNKRPRRNPLTSEEVAHIIAHKKKRELIILRKLKSSLYYKVLNVFNVSCIFIYLELLFCYFGPCHYQKHYSEKTVVHYGPRNSENGRLFIGDLDVYDVQGKEYKFVVEECIPPPANRIHYIIGKDFLLQKELKGVLDNSEKVYRLFSASPVLFLCIFISFISFFGYILNLNENIFTLSGLSILNFLTLFGIITI